MKTKSVLLPLLFLAISVLTLTMCSPSGSNSDSQSSDSVATPAGKDSAVMVADSDTLKRDTSSLGYPTSKYHDDDAEYEDDADNSEEYDPYDDADWDETTPGESRPEYFIRGNIPDPELYPEDEVKQWVEENGTEDEKHDVEVGNY